MSNGETREDLSTSVGEIANQMIDTFMHCTRNYEDLLPYLGKKETNLKIFDKLVKINTLLNKLNEELVGVRIEYVTDSPYEQQQQETVLSEGGRKRRMSDMSEVSRHETKCMKMEIPLSSSTECSVTLSPETGINMQSENLISPDTEETRHSQLQTMDMHSARNIKTGIQDSNEVEYICEFPVAQKSCDTTSNGVTVCSAGDEVSTSVAGILVGVSVCDKPACTKTQKENNEVSVPLQNVGIETSNQDKSEDSSSVVCEDQTERPSDSKESTDAFTNSDKECVILVEGSSNKEKCEDSGNILCEDQAKRPSDGKESTDSFTTSDKECVILVEGSSNQEKCENSGDVLCEDQAKRPSDSKESTDAFTTSDKECVMLVGGRANSCKKSKKRKGRAAHSPIRFLKDHVPIQRAEELCSAESGLYGIVPHKKKRFKCTLCKCVLSDYRTVNQHLSGKKHTKKLTVAMPNICIKTVEVPNNNCESTPLFSVYPAISCSLAGTVPINNCESTASITVYPAVSCSLADTVPSKTCESTASVSGCSAVSCSLADTVIVAENRYQSLKLKRAVRLDYIWTYFHPPFHINKKFLRFHLGHLICYLCYEQIGRYILNVRTHISRVSHLDRLNVLRNIELENKSSSKQLLDIPGSLKNIVPTTQFSLRMNGFHCIVCNCYCDNAVILSHMTGENHGKKLQEMKTNSIEPEKTGENCNREGKDI